MKRLIELESAQAARERAARLKKTISNLTTEEKLSPVAYWKMKKSVKRGTRKIVDGSIIMKSNGIQLTGREAVKGAYCIKMNFRRGWPTGNQPQDGRNTSWRQTPRSGNG